VPSEEQGFGLPSLIHKIQDLTIVIRKKSSFGFHEKIRKITPDRCKAIS